jgi:BirA family biotin operon repressor/biotin-[acetyl-CoA-carboxylase] ligase
VTALPSGWRRIAHATLDSTNAALKRLVAAGEDLREGIVVTAETQTAGRGRQGRAWISPPGNLYASFLIAAPDRPGAAPEIGFVAALAVTDAFAAPGLRLTCKWPNDVLAHGAKVCGILPELDGAWIVLGIGVNLRPTAAAAEYPATSLAERGLAVAPDDALVAIAAALAVRLRQWRSEGFAAIALAWSAAGPVEGESLSVRIPGAPGGTVAGAFAGLDATGALLLDTAAGRRRILAGEVLFAPALDHAGVG